MTKEQLIRGVELEDLIVGLENQLTTIKLATELKENLKLVDGDRILGFHLEKQHIDFDALKASSMAIITAKLEAARKEFKEL